MALALLREWATRLRAESAALHAFDDDHDVTGIHLKFDEEMLRRVREVAASHESSMRDRRDAEFRTLSAFAEGNQDALKDYGWDERRQTLRFAEAARPLIVVVDVLATSERDFGYQKQALVDGAFPVRVRRVPPARPFAAPGDRFNQGTLGGWIEDANGQIYGVSCEHVTGSIAGAAVTDGHGNIIGSVSAADTSTCKPPCNRHALNAGTLDVALVAMHRSVAIVPGPNVRVVTMSTIGQNEQVVFRGATSGLVQAEIAMATVWKIVTYPSGPICFGDLFTLQPRQVPYLISAVSQPGDSGAWVLDDVAGGTSPAEWYGMVIAGDYQLAYASYADNVLTWAAGTLTAPRLFP